jgi:hypothetical protein
LSVNNEKLNTDDTSGADLKLDSDIAFVNDITVNYQQRSLTFEFSALHFWQPARNVYAYKLEGFDKQWNYVSGAKNFAVYSNLGAGSYTFFVKATNNHGIWSDQIASMTVVVKPPLFLSTPIYCHV